MQAVLGQDDRNRGQLGHLVADRLAERVALRLREAVAAGAALGPMVDDLLNCLDRGQSPTVAFMTPLGSRVATRRRRPLARRRAGRILAGWQRGVARVAVQAPLKPGDALLLLAQPLVKLGNLCRERQERSDYRLASLLIDRLRLGALHAHGIRGV